MANSSVTTPVSNPNKNLYNGGSEWQNDYDDLPDYYQTYFRKYDATIGRFVGVDPEAASADSWTVYQYGYDCPGMFNDPMGNLSISAGGDQSNLEWSNRVTHNGSAWNDSHADMDLEFSKSVYEHWLKESSGGNFTAAWNNILAAAGKVLSNPEFDTDEHQSAKLNTSKGRRFFEYTHVETEYENGLFAGFKVVGGKTYIDDANQEAFNVSFVSRKDGKGVELNIYFTNPGYTYSSYQ